MPLMAVPPLSQLVYVPAAPLQKQPLVRTTVGVVSALFGTFPFFSQGLCLWGDIFRVYMSAFWNCLGFILNGRVPFAWPAGGFAWLGRKIWELKSRTFAKGSVPGTLANEAARIILSAFSSSVSVFPHLQWLRSPCLHCAPCAAPRWNFLPSPGFSAIMRSVVPTVALLAIVIAWCSYGGAWAPFMARNPQRTAEPRRVELHSLPRSNVSVQASFVADSNGGQADRRITPGRTTGSVGAAVSGVPPATASAPERPPTPAALYRRDRVRIFVTFMEHLRKSWLYPAGKYPCPGVRCEIVCLPKGQVTLAKGDLGKLRDADILMLNANTRRDGAVYDVLKNPLKKYLMMFTWENRHRDLKLFLQPPNQWWLGYLWHDPRLWERFHIVAAPEQGSIAPFNAYVEYLKSPRVTPGLRHAKPDRSRKVKDGLVSCLVGHPGNTFLMGTRKYNRLTLAYALNGHVPVDDPFGRLGQRRVRKKYRELGCDNDHWDPVSSLCIISNYHFHLAAENSFDWDYVSEKVYYPLFVGTVPLYIGAPNIDNFVPPKSIIKVTDFPSVSALARYLKCLVRDRPDLYDHYLNWRNRTAPHWEQHKAMPHTLCRACQLVAADSPVLHNVSARIPRPRRYILPGAQGLQDPFKECL